MLAVLGKGDHVELERGMGYVASRCEAVDDRVQELKDRLKVQIHVVGTLMRGG